LRRVLKNEPRVRPEALFRIDRSLPHGHVELLAMIPPCGFGSAHQCTTVIEHLKRYPGLGWISALRSRFPRANG